MVILIRCSILHLQLWRHKKITLIPHEEDLLCAKFQFFPWCGFRDTDVQSFTVFPTWLPHHMTYDVIIIKTFYMRSRSSGENFISIRQAVAVENMKVLCRQTNKQMKNHSSSDTWRNGTALGRAHTSARLNSLNFFFCGPIYPQMTLNKSKFSYWSDVAFYVCNYDVITKAPMT